MGKHAGHIRAEKGVCEKQQHDADHRDADYAPRGLDDQQHADEPHEKVRVRHRSGAQHQLLVFDDQIGGRRRAQECQHIVENVQPFFFGF